ncbi:MAG: type VI secretion system needle protein Hcp [Candidatus Symbiothrix sp.]|jgi:hypothetical protein|nr:type VI secretion system needle protein Hcp [Candidatus Symbiothrix sp.]
MALNFSGLSSLFEQVDTYIETQFVLDGKEYDIEHFGINFSQDVDHKGQPQHETRGGEISIVLTELVGDNIYDWAQRADKRKDGKILFRSQTEGTVLEIVFMNAYCIKLNRSVSSMSGAVTSLIISPEKVSLNGIIHSNNWRE